jgi:hypothetical protein
MKYLQNTYLSFTILFWFFMKKANVSAQHIAVPTVPTANDASVIRNSWPKETTRLVRQIASVAPHGIFSTGIENSDPWVATIRRNQLKEAHDFYENYEERLEKIRELGVTWLRFGEGYSFIHKGPDTYDFSITDKVLKKCNELGINVMIDLLHFGLPDWIHSDNPNNPYFQNEHFPFFFQRFVETLVRRYPHIKYFTPVNEPFVTAKLSALEGWWNEQRTDMQSFVNAVINIARAAILAKEAIEKIWVEENRPDEPIFFQNDSFEVAYLGSGSNRQSEVDEFNNIVRFAALDLISGHFDERVMNFFQKYGLSMTDYGWFMVRGNTRRMVLGIDHYPWSVYTYGHDHIVGQTPADPYQLATLIKEYWHRYKTPMHHMEVNAVPEYAEFMCQRTYDAIFDLQKQGYPLVGMSWFGDDLQIGWQYGLRGPNSFEEYRVGLMYKGQLEPVGQLFKDLTRKGFNSLNLLTS